MSIFYTALFCVCIVYILIQLFYLYILTSAKQWQFESYPYLPENKYPHISILVAARNEEANILHCLQTLQSLDYPEGKLEIIIGNDSSTDLTKAIIEDFIRNKPAFKCINLTGDEYPQTKGKARVLAVLASHAQGEVILITDADITVNRQWAKGMVQALVSSGAGMVAGVTNITANNFFTRFQQVDWLYFMGIFYTFSHIRKPISAVGNNMAILRKAYLETGGYETIPFSITEDYALFKAIRSKGYKTVQLMNSETLLYSKPIETLMGLLKQRRRWLVGGNDLPFYYRLMIFIFGSWYIALPVLLFSKYWLTALCLMAFKDLIQLFQIMRINRKLGMKIENPLAVFLYDIYLLIIIPMTAVYFFLPGKTVWKGRKY